MISKHKKKELLQIFETKKGKEYVDWIRSQPTYSTFDWVEYKLKE